MLVLGLNSSSCGGLVMKKLLIGSAAAAAISFGGAAFAADMPVKAPPPAPPVVAIWSCYVGGNVGAGWSTNQMFDAQNLPGLDVGSDTGLGIVGGGQVGCDYQSSNWVFGVRGMFDGADVQSSIVPSAAAQATGGYASTERLGSDTSWFGTVVGRLGYVVQPQWMAYAVGGVAWVHNKYTDIDPTSFGPFSGQATVTRTGWLLGVGLEYRLQRNWSLFGEYNYIGLASENVSLNYVGNAVSPYTYNSKQNFQTLLFGANYRFN